MRIAGRAIGAAHEPYVIAEIGVNHDGDASRALEMIDAAADAGADAVKLQAFRADLLMSRDARLAKYQAEAGESDPIEMLRRLELDIDALHAAVEQAHARGIHAIVTIFSLELVEEIRSLDWDAFKIASPDIVNRPLLESIWRDGRPMILSTGAATLSEVVRAFHWIQDAACVPEDRLALLQCVSAYPAPIEHAGLGGVSALLNRFDAPVGYSDHTEEIETGACAVAAGASILEKHVTWNRAASGPDHAASLEPDAFSEYAALARRAWRMVGPRVKRVQDIEADVRTASRQSLVTTRDLRAGEVIRREDLSVRRPGGGIEPARLDDIIGMRVVQPVEADRTLRREHLGMLDAAARSAS